MFFKVPLAQQTVVSLDSSRSILLFCIVICDYGAPLVVKSCWRGIDQSA